MKLTLQKALRLSIIRWDAIVKNNGKDLSAETSIKLDTYNLVFRCGLCERTFKGIIILASIPKCVGNCPLAIKLGKSCFENSSLYKRWENNECVETATPILEALRGIWKEKYITPCP